MCSAAKLFVVLRQNLEKNPRSAWWIVFVYARGSDLVSLGNCEMFLDFDLSFFVVGTEEVANHWLRDPEVSFQGPETVNPLCSLWCVSRMSSLCHTSAVLVFFMALTVGVGAQQSNERSCDVIGDESSESQMERALLKKLEPLSQMRYGIIPCRPRYNTLQASGLHSTYP